MPLLRNLTLVSSDNWVSLAEHDELPDDVSLNVVTLKRYLELVQQNIMPGGLIIEPADDVSLIEPFVQQLSLICIDFPVYTDGRGYSHARLLRKRMAYTGELRAIGDVRADQVLFMQRSGIDTYQFEEMPDTSLLAELTSRYKQNYQPSYPLLTRSTLMDT